jgi:hypothetical protein
MGFQESFEKLKESKWVVPTYIVLVILTTVGVSFLGQCLATILIPVFMFVIPYYMGEKRLRFFALLGVIVIFAGSVFLGLIYTEDARSYQVIEQESSDENNTITGGTITPGFGTADTPFRYTVTITTNETDLSRIHVYVNITDSVEHNSQSEITRYDLQESDSLDTNASDGKEYFVVAQLPEGIHFFHYAVSINGTWYDTLYFDPLSNSHLKALGPINATFGTIFSLYFQTILIWMVFTTILYFIFVMMYWWLGKAKIERTKWDERLREAGELEPTEAKIPEFECTNCGRPVHDDAIRCPHCGAIFEQGEEEETEEQSEPEERDL